MILVNDQGGILCHEDEPLNWQFEFDQDAVLPAIDTHAWQTLLNPDQGIDMKES